CLLNNIKYRREGEKRVDHAPCNTAVILPGKRQHCVLVALHSDGSSATTPHGMFYINHHYIHVVIKTTSRAP
ncbi:hypothetical protein L9F41_005790, partial [Klebsiella variicola]